MRKILKKHILCLLVGLMALMTPVTALAEGTSNYSFGSGGQNRVAPVAYEVEKVYHASDLGVDNLTNLSSMFVTEDSIYVSTGNAVLVLDYDFNVKHVLSSYKDEGGNDVNISSPEGLFVTDEGKLYVCEPNGSHVLVFDKNYRLLHDFGIPTGLDISVAYKPTQIVVDSLDRMYIIATNLYEGILEVNSDNSFQRYFGTTTVSVSLLDIFFRMIASEAQLSRQALLLPTEYTSMTINEKGFIYTTIQATSEVETPIRLLNVNGSDIMPENWMGNSPMGDEMYAITATLSAQSGPSSLVYIDCNEYGMYMVLDATRNRIFTYNSASDVLFVFGGMGDKDGCFRNPVSVRWLGDGNKVLVADRLSQSITVMKPTNYANAIFQAVKMEEEGDRTGAVEYWKQALAMNNNCNVAKDAIGRELYWEGEYEASQEYLGSIYRTDYYSMAFGKTREKVIRAYAPAAVVVLAVLIVAVKVFKRVRRSHKGGNGYAKG